MMWLISLVLLAGGGALVYYYMQSRRLLADMDATETYSAEQIRQMCGGAFRGLVEVQGQVSCDQPIVAPATQVPSCWVRTKVEHQERRVYLTRYGYRTYYTWITDSDRTNYVPFKVTDNTGMVIVDPANADIDTEKPFVTTTGNVEPWMTQAGANYSATGLYRVTEEYFTATGYAYVLGQAVPCDDSPNPQVLIRHPGDGYVGPRDMPFLISRKCERDLARSKQTTIRICLWLSIAAFIGAVYSILSALRILP